MKNLPEFCHTYSDMSIEGLEFLHKSFMMGHLTTIKGGLSVEFGSRRGGSAFLMLLLLQEIYSPDNVPMLFTVDPYGGKPYKGGDIVAAGLYGDPEFVAMKRLLSGFANHAHWYMESQDFLALLPAMRYWWRGTQQNVDEIAFAFLDGDHDAATILFEVRAMLPHMRRGGVILIDNVDKDPATIPGLQKLYSITRHDTGTKGNMLARIEVH